MKWSELSFGKQLGIVVLLVALVSGGAYALVYKSIMADNETKSKELASVKAENDSLRPFKAKLDDLNRQIESLKQQLEIQKRIVPDEKEADNFIRLVQSTAVSAGIEVRRFTASPTAAKEFFVEAPFELDIDGPYYSVVNFFDKMSKLERIINVSGLQMANTEHSGDAKVRRRYQYAPTETVVASIVATTYFSKEPAVTAAPAPGAKK